MHRHKGHDGFAINTMNREYIGGALLCLLRGVDCQKTPSQLNKNEELEHTKPENSIWPQRSVKGQKLCHRTSAPKKRRCCDWAPKLISPNSLDWRKYTDDAEDGLSTCIHASFIAVHS